MSKAAIQPEAPQPASLDRAWDLLNSVDYRLRQLHSLGQMLGHTGGTDSVIEACDVVMLGGLISDLTESIREDAETANGEIGARIREERVAGGAR